MTNTETVELQEVTQQLRVVNAYQHFLYYIEPMHIKENDPWESSGLLPHFMEKLIYYKRGEMYISTACVAEWFQNMNKSYQADLLKYIMKFHADKYQAMTDYNEKIELIYVGLVNNDQSLASMTKETRELFEFAYNYLAIFEPPPVNHIFNAVIDIWWDRYIPVMGSFDKDGNNI